MSNTIAKYTFLPWVRQGLAARLNKTDHLGKNANELNDTEAPSIDLTVILKGEKKHEGTNGDEKSISVPKQIQLYHTGDITGIESRAIVKIEPRNKVRQFEANFLPYIDFYEEDFPWRYTPLAPNKERLRPWLALVVLKEEEFEKETFNTSSPLTSFRLTGELAAIPFPSPYQLWAWAHVHINKKIDTEKPIESLKSLLSQDPNLACSRLICPRKLESGTSYFAFLIPAFERGRLAGMGATSEIINATDIQLAAWGHGQDHFDGFTAYQKRFPVYYEWTFTTGKAGADFETLAKKIVPRELHPNVGKRLVDIQSPGYNLFYEGGEFPNQGSVLMEGALRHPDSNLPTLLDDTSEEAKAFVKGLTDLINLEEDLKTNVSLPADHSFATNPYFEEEDETIYDDPIILPPLYGRWHAQQHRVSKDKKMRWVNQLNLDPRNRIAAGLGAEVVRRNQEEYMDRAWGQFGDLFNDNDFLKKSQFTLEVNSQLYKKHINTLHPSKLITVTANVHERIRPFNTSSLKVDLKSKQVPNGIFSSSYEKITRRGGALAKRTAGIKPISNNNLIGTLSFQIANLPKSIFIRDEVPNTDLFIEDKTDTILRRLLSLASHNLFKPNLPDWKLIALLIIGIPSEFQAGNHGAFKFDNALKKIVTNRNDVALGNYFCYKNWILKSNDSIVDLDKMKEAIDKKLSPNLSFHKKIVRQRKTISFNRFTEKDSTWLESLVKAPEFKDATYENLLNISLQDFVPNLDLVPPNTSGILKVNRSFLESFMVGLNYEMGRELLWREFPTDQRGTYFSLFWDSDDFNARAKTKEQEGYKDIRPIHEWTTSTSLGAHPQKGAVAEQLVLLIRGDLLNRYPNTLVYLEKAEVQRKERRLNGTRIYPIFEAKVEPDIFFLGFNITKDEVLKGEGHFFVFQERPGEIHFGLDSEEQNSNTTLTLWDELNWAHLEVVNHHIDIDNHASLPATDEERKFFWGRGTEGDPINPELGEGSSADMAAILYQSPVKIAIHATAMLLK